MRATKKLEVGRRPVFQAHAERQTVGSQDFLDFVQGLAAQIRGLEQFIFSALDQIADVVNVFGLQAVGAANREFEIVNRAHEDRIKRRRGFFLRLLFGFDIGLDGSEHGELILQNMLPNGPE